MSISNVLLESANSLLGVLLALSLIYLGRVFWDTKLRSSLNILFAASITMILRQASLLLEISSGFPVTEVLTTAMICLFIVGFYQMRKTMLGILGLTQDPRLIQSILAGPPKNPSKGVQHG
ncbi:MAG: hypothetical protein HYU39_08715 [Thaumarchaeota archaeon]|nr:hypothetical protein [Nitrososphaerota archaeon]